MTPKTLLTASLLWLATVLAACSGGPGSISAITAAPRQTGLPNTATAPTTAHTFTPTLPPSSTSTPSATATATSTATAKPTPEPTATNTPTVEPPGAAATGMATPELLALGRWQQLIGDCHQARRTLADLLAADPEAGVAAEARYRMAQCYLQDKAYAEAWATLAELLDAAPTTDPYRAPAQFLLGEALHALGNQPAAEAAYTAYLPLAPELAYLTQQRIGAARVAQGNLSAAAEAYRAALAVSPDWTNTVAIRRTLADIALEQGDINEAVAQYDALRGNETKGAWAAEMYYLAGNALARPAQLLAQTLQRLTPNSAAGTPTPVPIPAEALARWQAAVDADVTSRWAHAAIVALLDAGAAVDEYQRGRANYHNQVYALAIAAFDRLRAGTANVPGDTWYYAGLSHLALGNRQAGLAELDHFIANYPDDRLWAEAWLAKGQALARAGLKEQAIATYRRLAELRPDVPQAATALWRVAALLDDQPPSPVAAQAYLDMARRYPAAETGWRAYQAAGLIYFRTKDWDRAAAVWREMAGQPALAAFARPVAYFWLGRTLLAAGDQAGARQAWHAAQQADPYNFFSLRAAAWAAGQADAWVRERTWPPGAPSVPLPPPRPAAEMVEVTAWLRSWAGDGRLVPGSLPERVQADADWRRGKTLLSLGLRLSALAQWERLRTRYADDPWALAALAFAFRDQGAHRLSLLCAERLVAKWGRPMAEAPAALQRLAYPIPYTELIQDTAARQNLDPRLLAAIIRQESRFEGGATSVAGAQGLMQVMPGTAAGIARQLRWPNFQPQQAYLPYVNVAFGAFYVRQWLSHFDGSLFAALAAYNGGPGNAAVWYGWTPEDDDLLAALININETRVYVQAVWANYEVYRRLYPGP
ncbi:MAG: lytic transglycosylase domain-containing protein [Anaerolineae bacterium]